MQRLIAASLLAVAVQASATSLDGIYGGMADGCAYDKKAHRRIVMAYVDELEAGPKLARPSGGKRVAPTFGKAVLDNEGTYYTLTIALSGATLFGIPVTRLSPYRGNHTDIAGVVVTFPLPVKEVKARLTRAGKRLKARDHGWGEIVPELRATEDGNGTDLICDFSM